MTYRCEYFEIQELVPPSIFEKRGEKAWELLDERALKTLDALRKRFGSLIVNTWHSPSLIQKWGMFKWSGLRTSEWKHFSNTSQHAFGRAFDVKSEHFTPDEIREYVKEHPEEFPYLTSLEEGTDTWFHFDVRNCEPIKIYYPG